MTLLPIIRIIKFPKVKKLFNLDAEIIYCRAFLYHEVCVGDVWDSTCRVCRNMAATL